MHLTTGTRLCRSGCQRRSSVKHHSLLTRPPPSGIAPWSPNLGETTVTAWEKTADVIEWALASIIAREQAVETVPVTRNVACKDVEAARRQPPLGPEATRQATLPLGKGGSTADPGAKRPRTSDGSHRIVRDGLQWPPRRAPELTSRQGPHPRAQRDRPLRRGERKQADTVRNSRAAPGPRGGREPRKPRDRPRLDRDRRGTREGAHCAASRPKKRPKETRPLRAAERPRGGRKAGERRGHHRRGTECLR